MPDTSFEYTRSWLSEEDFPHLGFSRNWENPVDYPTYEPEEAIVRKDMQSLHDETKDYINEKLIPAVVESNSTEAYRTAAETARAEAETARAAAEVERSTAEEGRVAAENTRVEAEEKRTESEADRVASEAARISAEQARAEAESARVKAALSYPTIVNGTWQVWDADKGVYVDTGVVAQGQQGVSGVYVGSGEMPEGFNVQIDPDGEAVAPIGGVSSWNDLTDKPFYEETDGTIHPIEGKYLPNGTPWIEEGEMVEILPDYTIASEEDMAGIPALGLVEGNTYIVNLMGAEYTCVAWTTKQEGMTVVGLGDIYTVSGGTEGTESTGEPFVLFEVPPEAVENVGVNVMVQPLVEMSFPIVFSIYGGGTTIHKLDNRCLDLAWLPTAEKGENTILPTSEITGTDAAGPAHVPTANLKVLLKLVTGGKYIVNYNGTEYECVAAEVSAGGETVRYLGEVDYAATGTASSDYPFGVIDMTGTSMESAIPCQVYINNGSETATISISEVTEVPNKLPGKYLDLAWLPEAKETLLVSGTILASGNYLDNSSIVSLTKGQWIKVIWDNEEYYVALEETQSGLMAGNISFVIESYEDTGEPFVIISSSNGFTLVNGTSENHEVVAYKIDPNVMPKMFLPQETLKYSPYNMTYAASIVHVLEVSQWDALEDGTYQRIITNVGGVTADTDYVQAIPDGTNGRKAFYTCNARIVDWGEKTATIICDKLPAEAIYVRIYAYELYWRNAR